MSSTYYNTFNETTLIVVYKLLRKNITLLKQLSTNYEKEHSLITLKEKYHITSKVLGSLEILISSLDYSNSVWLCNTYNKIGLYIAEANTFGGDGYNKALQLIEELMSN